MTCVGAVLTAGPPGEQRLGSGVLALPRRCAGKPGVVVRHETTQVRRHLGALRWPVASVQDPGERLDDHRIQVATGPVGEQGERIGDGEPVRHEPVGGDRVEGIRYSDDPGRQRNAIAGQTPGVSRAVEVFVVVPDALGRPGEEVDPVQEPLAGLRVPFEGLQVLAGRGLDGPEHVRRQHETADVVEPGRLLQGCLLGCGKTQIVGDPPGQQAHPLAVSHACRVLGFQGSYESVDGSLVGAHLLFVLHQDPPGDEQRRRDE